MLMTRVLVFTAALTVTSTAFADDGPFDFEFEEVAPGVWAGVREDSPRFPVMGNVTFVIGEDGVLVFDGGGVPKMAEQTIEKIRSLTDAPVTHVAISHWHGDHNFGVYRYGEEFPNVQYVANRFTAAAMNSNRIDYISGYSVFSEERVQQFDDFLESGVDAGGDPLTPESRFIYERILEDAAEIDFEFKRVRLTQPNLVFDDRLTIDLGGRIAELRFLGHANTEGDIVLWLPEEKVVSTADIVVLPSPYAFNAPPRLWVATMERLNALGYDTLVPGHGPVQHNTDYVDLLIEVVTDIADQRDEMVERGMAPEDIQEQLDFSEYEQQFTGGDAYVKLHYDAWFEGPLRAAALKELTGERMVTLGPRVGTED